MSRALIGLCLMGCFFSGTYFMARLAFRNEHPDALKEQPPVLDAAQCSRQIALHLAQLSNGMLAVNRAEAYAEGFYFDPAKVKVALMDDGRAAIFSTIEPGERIALLSCRREGSGEYRWSLTLIEKGQAVATAKDIFHIQVELNGLVE